MVLMAGGGRAKERHKDQEHQWHGPVVMRDLLRSSQPPSLRSTGTCSDGIPGRAGWSVPETGGRAPAAGDPAS